MSNRHDEAERGCAEGMVLGYLEVVGTTLNPVEFAERRDELAGHLFELAAAHEELGMQPTEAMRAAIAKLGAPRLIGEAISGAKARQIHLGSAWRPVLIGSLTSALSMCLADQVLVGLGYYRHAGGWATALLGASLGLLGSAIVLRARLRPWLQAALVALLYGPVLLQVISSLNDGRLSPFVWLGTCLAFSLAGVATAVAAMLSARCAGLQARTAQQA
ncbi:MAG TPA: permease prefix domain 1-containing protein [Fimbriimonadaceae bacterium]|nr:permease prefix domain 1-containing protein [Fimbriimonadaceae bacterium]